MDEKKLVSFIIAAFNEEKFIKECIDTCLNQTYKNIEVCITDDGSTDNTLLVLNNEYGANPLVKIFSFSDNRGKVHAFNNSYKHAVGNIIAIIGADDKNKLNRVGKTVNLLKRYDLVCANSETFNDNGIILTNFINDSYGIQGNHKLNFEKLLISPYVLGGTIIANKTFLDKFFPLNSKLTHEDWWIPLCASYVGRGYFLDEPVIEYRVHDGQTSRVNNKMSITYECWKSLLTRDLFYYKLVLNTFNLTQELRVIIESKMYEREIYNCESFFEQIQFFKKIIRGGKLSLNRLCVIMTFMVSPKLVFKVYCLVKGVKANQS